jgi:L-fucose isomerase-like protein
MKEYRGVTILTKTKVLYLPIGRKTFDLEAAKEQWEKSSNYLNEIAEVVEPEGIITSPEELEEFLQKIDSDSVVTTIYQSVTFADGEFIYSVINKVKAPVIVWSVREPSVGGRLRLNSLTGGNSTSHVLRSNNHSYSFVFGNADEAQVQQQIKKKLAVQQVIKELEDLKIGVIGEHPPGFFFSDTDDELLKEKLGTTVTYFDLHEAFEECVKLPKEKWEGMISRAEQKVIGLNRSDETVERFAQFSTYVKEKIDQEGITALAVRCWPDFFNELGAAACSTLSQFTEDGVVSSCESDIHGSISMFILRQLANGSAPYLGDMVHINEASNSAVFWHCGAGAYSLAHPETGATAGVHPNRKMGFTMEFGLKPGRVTLFRVGYTAVDGYRLLIMRGDALDTPQRFNGTSVEVKLETDVSETLYKLMEEGFEPHYALVYEDVVEELVELGRQLGIKTTIFTN